MAKIRILVLAICFCALPAFARAQASIAGVVKDSSGAVLPGVTIEASSPALIEKTRLVMTDSAGQYKVVDLRPGTYVVTFTLAGFSTVRREGIELTGTFVASVDAEMRVGAVEESVTVTGETPIVDVQNVTRNRVLNKAVIEAIPSSRSPITLAATVPGVTSNAQDVGGSTMPIGQTNLSVHGGRPGDWRITMDGLTTQSALCTGGCGNYLPNTSSAQEMNIIVAAGSAEQSLGGVVINVIPREGGNTFSGSLFGAFANASMQGSNYTQRLKDAGLATPTTLKKSYDVNGAFGGRLIADRAWFFASLRQTGYGNYVGGMFDNLNAGNPNAWTYVPDKSRPAYSDVWQRTGNVRLTWQVTPRNKLAFFYDRQSRCNCPADGGTGVNSTITPEAAHNPHTFPGNDLLTINWSSPLTNRLLLEGSVMTRRENMELGKRPEDSDPAVDMIPVVEQSTGLQYRATNNLGVGSGGSYLTEFGRVSQLKAAVSYVTGTHALKAGIQQQFMSLDVLTDNNRPELAFRFNNAVPNQLTEFATPFPWSQRNPWDLGVFVQDRWTVQNRLTLNLGARFDYYTTYYPEQHVGPTRFTPTRDITFPRADFMNYKDISPRVAASYDLFGNGRTAVKVSGGRYLAALGLETTVTGTFNPTKTLVQQVTRSWTDANQNFVPDCNLQSTAEQDNRAAGGDFCGAMSNALFGQPIPSTTIDPRVITGWGTRDYNWEFSTGVQQQLARRLGVEVTYFRRIYGGSWSSLSAATPNATIDNLSVSPADFDPFQITAPLDPRLPGGGGYTIANLYDLNPTKVGQVKNVLTTPDYYGNRIEHWNGVDATVSLRLTGALFFQGGVSAGRTVTDNCQQLAALPEDAPLGLPYCHVDTPFLTQIKFNGAYTIPHLDVQIAGTFQSLPGPQITANYNAPSAVVAPSLGRQLSGGAANATVNLVAPGTMYGERLNQLDLRFGKILRFGRTRTALNLDVYNALNVDTILTYSNNYANWLKALSNLQGRFAKINVQLDF